ncbi:MAG: EAL domain-containing protein [Pseudomonadota bacterium]|nr:EAL domain-containing protein [Pseudomonadota bacterium]
MSDTTNQDTLPDKLNLSAVIGLSQPGDGDWSNVQGSQYALLSERVFARVLLHVFGLVLVFSQLHSSVSWTVLGGWTALLIATIAHGAVIDRKLADAGRRLFTRREYWGHAANQLAKGAVWGSLVAYAALAGNLTGAMIVWGVTALLVVTSSASRFSAPLGAIAFCGAIGLVSSIAFIISGAVVPAALAFATALCGAGAAVETARISMTARVAQTGMDEKSQVVSFLLREYEDTDADWLFELDTGRRLRSVTPRLAFALSRELDEIEGASFIQLIAGDAWETGKFPPSLHVFADKLKRRESFSDLVVEVSIGGKRRWWELSGTAITAPDGSYAGFRGVGSDVTEQQESSTKIAYLARYDTLTSLPNRLMLTETLGAALRYAEKWRTRCAFLMIDLDRFKAVNDSLGHLVGDRMLSEVAKRLNSLMTENEMCGRLGGDEFAVVIRDAGDRSYVSKVAQSIIQHLSEPYQIDHHVLYVGASIGAAFGPRDGRTVEELMRNADLSLYRVKDEGGGQFHEYEPSLHATAEERRKLELSLRSALANNELFLNFQPVVNARSENLVSFEALVRWKNPDHGIVSPAKFIPLAEDTRLIVPIGQWVMQEACNEAATWPEYVKINVNVSPEQLLEPDFATTVVQALSRSGLTPSRLEIEVTESIFLRDADVARRALEQVMALGCSVALDDFGTGYSSLGYLRKLKFSTIKVDRSFVQGASQNSAESLAIINAVVAMAGSLGMTTTAEGVETAEEAAMIRDMGCDKIQGYHFGRPMPVEEVRAVFKRSETIRTA